MAAGAPFRSMVPVFRMRPPLDEEAPSFVKVLPLPPVSSLMGLPWIYPSFMMRAEDEISVTIPVCY